MIQKFLNFHHIYIVLILIFLILILNLWLEYFQTCKNVWLFSVISKTTCIKYYTENSYLTPLLEIMCIQTIKTNNLKIATRSQFKI